MKRRAWAGTKRVRRILAAGGRGARRRGAADLADIPVATTATGKSAVAETHPLALGVFGNWGQAVANEVVSNADTFLVIGSRLSPTDTCFENPELLDADRQAFLQIDVEVRATPAHREAARRRCEHLAELKGLDRYFAEPEQRSSNLPLRPERVINELAARLGERALVTMDAGANRLNAVCGDGGFAMMMNAVLPAAQYRIPVTTVVLDNGVLGWVKDGQRRRGNRFIASELGKLDYARMAQSMGCRGARVESLAELAQALGSLRDARA